MGTVLDFCERNLTTAKAPDRDRYQPAALRRIHHADSGQWSNDFLSQLEHHSRGADPLGGTDLAACPVITQNSVLCKSAGGAEQPVQLRPMRFPRAHCGGQEALPPTSLCLALTIQQRL